MLDLTEQCFNQRNCTQMFMGVYEAPLRIMSLPTSGKWDEWLTQWGYLLSHITRGPEADAPSRAVFGFIFWSHPFCSGFIVLGGVGHLPLLSQSIISRHEIILWKNVTVFSYFCFLRRWKIFPEVSRRLALTSHWPDLGHVPTPKWITHEGSNVTILGLD